MDMVILLQRQTHQQQQQNHEDAVDYGYGDTDKVYNVPLNENDHHEPRGRPAPERRRAPPRSYSTESYGDYDSNEDQPLVRRQRYRRRGSVTKYSIEAQTEVQKTYDEHEQLIEQFRTQATISSSVATATAAAASAADSFDEPTGMPNTSFTPHDDNEGNDDYHNDNNKNKKDTKKKKGWRRFSIR